MIMRPMVAMMTHTYLVELMIVTMATPLTMMNMVATPYPLFVITPTQECMTTMIIMH